MTETISSIDNASVSPSIESMVKIQFFDKLEKLLEDMAKKIFSFDFMQQISSFNKIDDNFFIEFSKFKE